MGEYYHRFTFEPQPRVIRKRDRDPSNLVSMKVPSALVLLPLWLSRPPLLQYFGQQRVERDAPSIERCRSAV